MNTIRRYEYAIDFIAEYAPPMETQPSKFIEWAETVVDLLSYIYYTVDCEVIQEDLRQACAQAQGFELDAD